MFNQYEKSSKAEMPCSGKEIVSQNWCEFSERVINNRVYGYNFSIFKRLKTCSSSFLGWIMMTSPGLWDRGQSKTM